MSYRTTLPDQDRQRRVHRARGLVVAAAVALVLLAAALGWGRGQSMSVKHSLAVISFLVDLLICAGVVFGLGKAVTNQWTGIALSGRNRYSLSRVQMACWTVVVVAALLTVAKLNLLDFFGAMPDGKAALEIGIPGELLAALGIAAFSTSATPAILALKAGQEASASETMDGLQRQATASGSSDLLDVTSRGKLVGNASPQLARWLDIFTGDELANAGTVDLSKVQQALVTVLLLGTYSVLVIRALATAAAHGMADLPPLSASFIQLLAVSHAGYLVYKAVPKSGAADVPSPTLDTTSVVAALRGRAGMPGPPRA